MGKAARFNIRSNSQAITFINYILKVSDLRSLDHIYLELESLKNLGKYIKNRLVDYFTNYWKGQFQESRSNGKLRTLVQVKNNFRFEEYLHVICNVKHRLACSQPEINYQLNLADITKPPTMSESARYVNQTKSAMNFTI